MFLRWITLLLILHYFQGQGNCISVVSPSVDKPEQRRAEATVAAADQTVKAEQSPEAAGDDSDALLYGRWRRHIGSIAAFGGFPITANKNKAANRPHSSALISRDGGDALKTGGHLMLPEPIWRMAANKGATPEAVSKEKRYPEDVESVVQPPSGRRVVDVPSPRRFLVPQTAFRTPQDISVPFQNEARSRALSRLLRLLAAVHANPKLQSKSKKFLGSLARSNGLPTATSPTFKNVPTLLYKGSTAIPLPGKRSSGYEQAYYMSPKSVADLIEDVDSLYFDEPESGDIYDDLTDASDNDVNSESDEEEEMREPIKRHLSSALKSGWFRRPASGANKNFNFL